MPVAAPPLAAPANSRRSDLANHHSGTPRVLRTTDPRKEHCREPRLSAVTKATPHVASFPGSHRRRHRLGRRRVRFPARALLRREHQRAGEPAAAREAARWFVGLERRLRLLRNHETRLPCQQPPWGSSVAVDVNTGTIAWRSTWASATTCQSILKNTGRISAGGPILTASGLTFIGATDDNRIRAFDTRTGAELWSSSCRHRSMARRSPIGAERQAVRCRREYRWLRGRSVESDTVTTFALP